MRFCTACGTALELFEFLDGELCTSCLKDSEKKPASSGKTQSAKNVGHRLLPQAVVAVEEGKLVIKSPEGWVLWSGSLDDDHQLDTILSQAERIHTIRMKRQKN